MRGEYPPAPRPGSPVRRKAPGAPPVRALLALGRIEFAGFLCGAMLSAALALRGSGLPPGEAVVLLGLAVFANLWGFAHNDWCDAALDRTSADLAARPLVSGTVSVASVRLLLVACISANVVLTLLFRSRFRGTTVLLASMLLAWAYNRCSKTLPASDLLFAGSTALLCLLGALPPSMPHTHGEAMPVLVWYVVAVEFVEYALFNAGSTLKDVRNDRDAGAVTAATVLGVRVGEDGSLRVSRGFRGALLLLRSVSLLLLFAALFHGSGSPSLAQVALLGAVGSVSWWLLLETMRVTRFERARIGRRWMRQDAVARLLVPLLLLPAVGWGWTLALALAPPAWFLFWNRLLHGRSFEPARGF